MAATGPYLAPGSTVPGTKYQIVKSLGAGGMGIVYQVVKPPNIGGVLKLMSSELTAHQEHRTRFFDEVRILAQLDHPNIVRVFDYDALPDGAPFYVMELLSGRTVRDVLETMGHVPPRIAYEITRQLLDALQCAHTHEVPVIHRDIKPENIFLHAPRHGEPVVKLIDFGVSAVADRAHDGAFVGTWSYAAPEQIRGEVPTAETDLYAVGLVLYEMLTGHGPFDQYEDWNDVSLAQLEEIPAPVSRDAPWVPASIVALVQSALAKDPKLRPRSAWAFAERLYELEYASDGEGNARPKATEVVTGPVMPVRIAKRPSRLRPDGEVSVAGTGPLARVLTSVAQAPPVSSQRAPRRTPVDDSTNALLAGLGPTSRRSSDPAYLPPTSSRPHGGATAVTLDEPLPLRSPSRDTFSSQSTDARGLPKPRGRLVMVVIACALVFASVVAAALLLRGRPPPPTVATTASPPSPPSPAVPSVPPPAVTGPPPPATSVLPVAIPPSVMAPSPSVPKPVVPAARPAVAPSRPAAAKTSDTIREF